MDLCCCTQLFLVVGAGPLWLRSTGSWSTGSAVLAHGLSCPTVCGILPNQGLNPCPLCHQADSQLLDHQGSLQASVLGCKFNLMITLQDWGHSQESKRAETRGIVCYISTSGMLKQKILKENQVIAMLLLLLSCLSHVRLCTTPQTAAHQAPPSLGFSRQEHWSGLPFPSPMHESEK